jgi:hypothetical protein
MITLNRKWLLSMFTLVLCLGLGLTAVSAQSRISPIGLVPPSAVAVAKLKWTVIRQDDRFRRMLNADQLDRALAQLKIDGADISDIVIFSGINSSPTGVLAGIFRGTFSVAEVTSQLNSQGLTAEVYKARTIYFNPADQSYSTLLRSGMLVIGSRKGVQGVIDVETSPRQSLMRRRPFSSILARFVASRQPISFVMSLPLEYQTVADVGVKVISTIFRISGLGPFGFVIEKIGFPHAMGFTMAHSSATYPAELVAQMKDATSAALISGTLNVTQAIGLNMPSDRMSPSDREMLKDISVTRAGALLSIKLVLRERDLPQPPRR